MLVLSSLEEKVRRNVSASPGLMCSVGAAVDKVRALEKAGVIVTDSPAKIGEEMLKVRLDFSFATQHILTLQGHARVVGLHNRVIL